MVWCKSAKRALQTTVLAASLLLLLALLPGGHAAVGDDATSGNFGYVWIDSVSGQTFFDDERGTNDLRLRTFNGGINVNVPNGFEWEYYGENFDDSDVFYMAEDGAVGIGTSWATGQATGAAAGSTAPTVGGANGHIAVFQYPQHWTCTSVNSPVGFTFSGNTNGQQTTAKTAPGRASSNHITGNGHERWVLSWTEFSVAQPGLNSGCTDYYTYAIKFFDNSDIGELHYNYANNLFGGEELCYSHLVGFEDKFEARGLPIHVNTDGGCTPYLKWVDYAIRFFKNDDLNAKSDTWITDAGVPLDVQLNGNDDPLLYQDMVPPTQGTATALPSELVYGQDVFSTYTPNPGFFGVDRFTFDVDDGYDKTITATKTIIVNSGPVAFNDTVSLSAASGPVQIDVRQNDVDLFWSQESGAVANPELQITAIDPVPFGTIQIAPDGKSVIFDPEWVGGEISINYTISDGRLTSNATLNLSVEPIPLVLTVVNNDALEVIQFANATLLAQTLQLADPLGDPSTIVYTWTTPNGLAYTRCLLNGVELAPGATFTQQQINDGNITFESLGTVGTDLLELTIVNSEGDTQSLELNVTVVPAAPPRADFGTSSPPFMAGLSITLADATQPGDYPVEGIAWQVLDPDGSLIAEGTESVLNFLPTVIGEYTVTLTATDIHGLTASKTRGLLVDQLYQPPTARFLASTVNPVAGEDVTFWDISEEGSYDIETRDWNFQDPHEQTDDAAVVHVFERPGTYTVTLTVRDSLGRASSAQHEIHVGDAPEAPAAVDSPILALMQQGSAPPLADAGPDQIVLAGSIVELDGTNSRPGQGAFNLTYQWRAADGEAIVLHGADTATPRFVVPYLNNAEQSLLLELVVRDETGRESAPDKLRLVVRSEGAPSLAPIAEPTGDFTFEQSPTGLVTFTAMDGAGPGVRYTWNFGDGTTLETENQTVTYRYQSAGVYHVRLRVEDSFQRVAEYQRAAELMDPATSEADAAPVAPPRPNSAASGAGPVLGMIAIIGGTIAVVAALVMVALRKR